MDRSEINVWIARNNHLGHRFTQLVGLMDYHHAQLHSVNLTEKSALYTMDLPTGEKDDFTREINWIPEAFVFTVK